MHENFMSVYRPKKADLKRKTLMDNSIKKLTKNE